MTFRCGHPKIDANSYFLPKRVCKICHTMRANRWRDANRDYYRAWNRRYYRRRWRDANRGYYRAWNRYYRLRHCDPLTRAWRGIPAHD